MPCTNHPEVLEGLDTCTRCGKSFCIDCLVGRKSGWFCAPCDAAVTGSAPAAAAVAKAAEPKPELAPIPAPSVLPPRRACTNHPEVVDRLNPCSRCRKNFCPDCLVELKSGRYCAGCKTEAVKDMQSGVDQTQLPLAHMGRRFVAWLVDFFVMLVLIMPMFAISGYFSTMDGGVPAGGVGLQLGLQALAWVIPMAYKAIMLQMRGQTLGKMALGIKVVNPDGSDISPGQAWMRAFIELLLASCCYVTYIVAFFSKDHCALHDMAAKTRVIRVS
jgi:uncharacterized RDD family membrane protein YckC